MMIRVTCFLFWVCVSNVANAAQVSPGVRLVLAHPSAYDGDVCDQIVFSDALFSILKTEPKQVFGRSYVRRPLFPGHPWTLKIELAQAGFGTSAPNITIYGKETDLKKMERAMVSPGTIKLTEFKACAEKGAPFTHVEHVEFMPQLEILESLDLSARIEIIRKDNQGICVPNVSPTLGDLIRMKHPHVDLSTVSTRVGIKIDAVNVDMHEVISKKIQIQFVEETKAGLGMANPVGPAIEINLSGALVYSVLNELSKANGTLSVSRYPGCKGERADDPHWIYDLRIE